MTEKDQNSGADQTSDDLTVETTSVFRADFLNELDAPAAAGTEGAVSGVEGLPVGSALLVVKRGPNAGSRFLLDQPTTSAGRHPDSDIFLDDVTVSRRHAEFRLENARVPGRRRGQPQRHLRQQGTGRLGRARQRRRSADRQVPPGVPDRSQDATTAARAAKVTAPDTPALAGMSIGAVLDSLRPDFPDVTISKIRFLEAEGLVTPQRIGVGLSAVHRLRLRSAAVHPDRAARPVPALEGDQGATRRPARRRAPADRIRLRRTAFGAGVRRESAEMRRSRRRRPRCG